MPIKFEYLDKSDLIIDETYNGDVSLGSGGDPICKILKVQNSGGFRFIGKSKNLEIPYCALYTTLSDPDWPDFIDTVNGMFVYYGDNKKSNPILRTRGGNNILQKSFEYLHSNMRKKIPPFFIFSRANGRDVIFRGLAVPGFPSLSNTDDLVAIWSSKDNRRFQNYKATFSILDVNTIKREWLDNLLKDKDSIDGAPSEWIKWKNNQKYRLLTAKPTRYYRKKEEQIPKNKNDLILLETVYNHFKNDPFEFENFSCEIIKHMDKNVSDLNVTQKWKDGGRDGLGVYSIGNNSNHSLKVDFAIEAKCYDIKNGCNVKASSRLISRLRHRQFGIFITTSYLNQQAYKEIIDDKHPVLIISGIDLVEIIKTKYASTKKELENKLNSEFFINK